MADEPTNPTPPADPAATPPADPPPVPPASDPADPADPPKDPPAPADPRADPPPAQVKTLLDDDDPPAEPKADDPADPAGPSDEDVQKFCEGIPALDMGDGVKWDDATLKAMAPSLMELTGNDPAKAHGVVKAYCEFAQRQAKAQMEAQDAFSRGLVAECQKRFGEDLKKVATLAKQGGLAIFGEQIWNEMKKVPAFANNPDIMERLAEAGRRYATDGGKVLPKGSEPAEKGDVLHRLYGNVKV
jgi:hypothetical protein